MIRLASYNIRKAVGLDWRRDPARIVRVIGELGADIVALQEADKRLGPRHSVLDRGRLLHDTGLRPAPAAHGPSLGFHGNALLVREDWQITEMDGLSLPGIEPRGALMANVDTGVGHLTIIATHLGLRRGCRQLQLAHILEAAGRRSTDRTVILGDFNEWSPRIGFDVLAPGFRMVSPGHSFHASRPVACLDRFALGRDVRLLEAGVFGKGEALRASDHLPVWANIALVSG